MNRLPNKKIAALTLALFFSVFASHGSAQVKLAGQTCEVESDLSDKDLNQALLDDADGIVNQVNRFYELLGFSRLSDQTKVQIRFFTTIEKMKSHVGAKGFKDVNMQGYFNHDSRQIGVAYLGSREETKRLLIHEVSHLLMQNQGGNIPPWVDEGFADFLSRDPDALQFFETKKLPAVTQLILKTAHDQGKLPSIDDLSKIEHAHFYNEEADVRYAYSVALMAYVLNNQGPRIFGNFVRAVRRGENPRVWMTQNVDLKFEEKFNRWILS